MTTQTKKNARSGNPAKKAAAKKASSISAFKQRKAGVTVELPSGLAMTVRRVSLETFIKQGDIPNPLLPLVEEALKKGQEVDVEELIGAEGEVELDKVQDMLTLVDAIVCQTAVSPPVLQEPDDEADRDGDLLYVDEVEAVDKMFIFQFAIGGTSDLERFHEELAVDMGSLAEISSSSRPAKRTSRSRSR